MYTFENLIKFVSLRPRSEYEITSWFRRKKIAPDIQADLLSKLKTLNLINDDYFATWWVTQRLEFKPKSKRMLKLELTKKGIAKEIISKVLEEQEIDEFTLVKNLVDRKMKHWQKLDEDKKKKKIINFLQARGFGWEVIRSLFDEL